MHKIPSKQKNKMKIKSLLYLTTALLLNMSISAKLLVITHSYNRPEFIELQEKTFKTFLKDEYEFIVFNDAPGNTMRDQIFTICARLGLRCIRIPQEIHTTAYLPRDGGHFNDPCTRCADVVQYSLNTLGFLHDDLVMIIDSDMFLVKDFSLRHYLQGFSLAGKYQNRANVYYLWNGLLFFDMKTLPEKSTLNFNCGRVEGQAVDVGGYTYYYLKKYPDVVHYLTQTYLSPKIQDIELLSPTITKKDLPFFLEHRCPSCQQQNQLCYHNANTLKKIGLDDTIATFYLQHPIDTIEFLVNNSFLHYQAGANWDHKPQEYHVKKAKMIHLLIDDLIKYAEAHHDR